MKPLISFKTLEMSRDGIVEGIEKIEREGEFHLMNITSNPDHIEGKEGQLNLPGYGKLGFSFTDQNSIGRPADTKPIEELLVAMTFESVFGQFPRHTGNLPLRAYEMVLKKYLKAGRKMKFPIKTIRLLEKKKEDAMTEFYASAEGKDLIETPYRARMKSQRAEGSFDSAILSIALAFSINEAQVIFDKLIKEVFSPSISYMNTQDIIGMRAIHTFVTHILLSPLDFTENEKKVILKHYSYNRVHDIPSIVVLADEPDFPINAPFAELKQYMIQHKANMELIDVKRKMKSKGFEWEELRVDLKDSPSVTEGKLTIRMLEATDTLAIALGDLTHCCQQLNGAGETCMFEGLVNPHSGFLVFEEGAKIIAQAWVWEDKQGGLVFDNIEFGDFKGEASVKQALVAWLEASSYENVQLGKGYSETTFDAPDVSKEDKHDLKERVWTKNLYTDANNRVWLKKKNVVTI